MILGKLDFVRNWLSNNLGFHIKTKKFHILK